MRVRHILLKTPFLVETIMTSLRQGADFAILAREHSACPSAAQGGDWGILNANDLPSELVEALQEAPVGDVVGPIKSRHGLHLMKIEQLS